MNDSECISAVEHEHVLFDSADARMKTEHASSDTAYLNLIINIAKHFDIDEVTTKIQGREREAELLTHAIRRQLVQLLNTTHTGEIPQLSDREQLVLEWAACAKSAGVTAQILGVTEKTVRVALSNIMKKMQCNHPMECVVKAIRLGLI